MPKVREKRKQRKQAFKGVDGCSKVERNRDRMLPKRQGQRIRAKDCGENVGRRCPRCSNESVAEVTRVWVSGGFHTENWDLDFGLKKYILDSQGISG